MYNRVEKKWAHVKSFVEMVLITVTVKNDLNKNIKESNVSYSEDCIIRHHTTCLVEQVEKMVSILHNYNDYLNYCKNIYKTMVRETEV